MNRTAIVTDPLFEQHDPGPWHPESPARLAAIRARLAKSGLAEALIQIQPRPASREEICRVHSDAYYQRVEAADGRSVALDPDTSTSPASYRAAMLAAGGALVLCEQVMAKEVDNGFALVRPPGHHAERAQARGFCLFNNVAICAEHLLGTLGAKRVAVVDWDLHHGNGTMHSFFDRDDLLYLSTHQYPYYPGSGALQDVGQGKGEGYTVSIPLSTGMGDHEYGAIFRDVVLPVVRQYEPDLILVSAGFDTLNGDPLGGMRMTTAGYGTLTGQLMDLATEVAGGRLVMLLEGGYNVELEAESVEHVLRVLRGEWSPAPVEAGAGRAAAIIEAVKRILGPYWKLD